MRKNRRAKNVPYNSNSAAPYDYLSSGAGFAGSVLAERLASQPTSASFLSIVGRTLAETPMIATTTPAFLCHRLRTAYLPYQLRRRSSGIFRSSRVWRPYEHRVLAKVDGMLVPIPINLDTVNRLYGLSLNPDQLAEVFRSRAERSCEEIKTSEDVVVSTRRARTLREILSRLHKKAVGRRAVAAGQVRNGAGATRLNHDDRYFGDEYQFMPLHGYTRMFERMVDHPNINVMLQTDFEEVRNEVFYRRLIFTGPIDEYLQLPLR